MPGRNNAGKLAILAQPANVVGSKVFNFHPAFATGNDGSHHKKSDIDKVVLPVNVAAVVFNERQVGKEIHIKEAIK